MDDRVVDGLPERVTDDDPERDEEAQRRAAATAGTKPTYDASAETDARQAVSARTCRRPRSTSVLTSPARARAAIPSAAGHQSATSSPTAGDVGGVPAARRSTGASADGRLDRDADVAAEERGLQRRDPAIEPSPPTRGAITSGRTISVAAPLGRPPAQATRRAVGKLRDVARRPSRRRSSSRR